MSHFRLRFAVARIQKLASLWPALGVLGPRQVGKTFLLRSLLQIPNFASMDNENHRDGAESSTQVFLSRWERPLAIDEVQKVPKLFDAVKAEVDESRRPGMFYLSGSTQFSQKIGIRESLTGRIGIVNLHPLTLAECLEADAPSWEGRFPRSLSAKQVRFPIEKAVRSFERGGMPVPAFLRDGEMSREYWRSWFETSLYRDLASVHGRGFNPRVAESIFRKLGELFRAGELPVSASFDMDSRKFNSYINSMEILFLVKRIRIHENGIGRDAFLAFDSGFATHLMGDTSSSGATLTLARHFVWNEVLAHSEYAGTPLLPTYFKSAKGQPIDIVWDGVPMRIVAESGGSGGRLGWHETAVLGAMKKLNSKQGFLIGPFDRVELAKPGEVGLLPYTYWS